MRGIAIWQFLNFLRDHSPVSKGSPIHTALDRVRNLVLLAEERDLRQVPEAALQMNAVRLMTIHGSKGLEFEAVHVPGLVVTGLPANIGDCGARRPRTWSPEPPARSAEQGRQGPRTGRGMPVFRRHVARPHAYAALLHEVAGERKSPKPFAFLARVQAKMQRIDPAPTLPLPVPPQPTRHPGDAAGRLVSDRPARDILRTLSEAFFLHPCAGHRHRTPGYLLRTHSFVHLRIDQLAVRSTSDGNPVSRRDPRRLRRDMETARGPPDPAYAADYLDLARNLVDGLIEAGAGRRFREAEPLALDFANGRVLVEAAEIAERADGVIVVRRIRVAIAEKRSSRSSNTSSYQRRPISISEPGRSSKPFT